MYMLNILRILNTVYIMNLSEERMKKVIDRYDSATHEAAARYASFAYKQGLKDMFNLFMSLQDKKEQILS